MKLPWNRACANLLVALTVLLLAAGSAHSQQVLVVNMVKNGQSGETNDDSETNLAVNPSNLPQIAGTAFTPPEKAGNPAPIFVSSNGGKVWDLNPIVPGATSFFPTGDITIRFSGTNRLYAGILRANTYLGMNILRTNSFLSPTPMTMLVSRAPVDQPWVEATTVLSGAAAGKDRIYIGNNDFTASNGRTATIDFSLDAAKATTAADFTTVRLESRTTSGQDGPSVRPAIHQDGTIYAAFFGWCAFNGAIATTDVVVVRDDSWGAGPNPFTALKEPSAAPGDGLSGIRVVRSRMVPWDALLGLDRTGSDLALAVDPTDSSKVYIAWNDRVGTTDYTLHVRNSTDRGVTWSTTDLRTITNARNPGLAVNSAGKVGLLYQQLTVTGASKRWATHLERTSDGFQTVQDLVLANAPVTGWQGDYLKLQAVGTDFYGIFNADNTPDLSNFPNGVVYQRNANFTTKKLLALDNVTEVRASIDPFFFVVKEKEPGPRYAYVGCNGDHHLAGDTGTGLYLWRHHKWLVNLEYDRRDADFWYYHEKEYPDYQWAFARQPNHCGDFAVWFWPDDESKGKWAFYQYAQRIRPVNADPKAARTLRAVSRESAAPAAIVVNLPRDAKLTIEK